MILRAAIGVLLLAGIPAGARAAEDWGPGGDLDPGRIFWAPTALMAPPGEYTARAFEVVWWQFDFPLAEWAAASVVASPPLMNVGVLPGLKLAWPVGGAVHLGVQIGTGFWTSYGFDDLVLGGMYGGGPILTIGDADASLTSFVLGFGATVLIVREEHPGDDTSSGGVGTYPVVLPGCGGVLRVSQMVKLVLEVHAPVDPLNLLWITGTMWGVLYGVRLTGESVWGDLGFLLPLWPPAFHLFQYLPLGIPALGVGWTW
jgi:hypothetical protein